MDRVQREFEAVGDAQLIENIVQVIFHRLLADEQFFANFLVPESLRHQLHDFFFAVADSSGFSRRGPDSEDFANAFITSAVMRLSSQISPACTRWMLFTSKSVADCFSTTPRAPSRIARTTSRSSSAAVSTITRVGIVVEIHFFEDGQAVFIRHAQIQQQNFRLEFREKLDALGAVLRFADDGDFLVAIEEFAEAVAEDRVVVRHQGHEFAV